MLKLTTGKHEVLRGFSATAELLVRALSRHGNILLHAVYDYFGEENFSMCCNELGIDAKHVSISR